MFHIVRQAVNQLRDPVQIIGDAGGVRAERDGAENSWEEYKETRMISCAFACVQKNARQGSVKIRSLQIQEHLEFYCLSEFIPQASTNRRGN